MKMDEIMRESTSDSKDSESNVLGTVNFESELLNCVKEVVENISKNEKEDEDSNERHFLNSMDEENSLPIQIQENTSSDISALFEMATKNSSTEFQPFNPFCGFTSIREPCEGVVISASEPKINFDGENSFKTVETSRKPRKKIRRKKWCVKRRFKKNEVAAEHSQLAQNKNCGNGYARLYESCLNFCHHFNEEVPSLSLAASDGVPLPENELIVLMARDLISKIDKDNAKLANEKKSLREEQIVLLKKLVKLLKDKPCSEEAELKNNLPLKVDESSNKFDFCGFQSSKPQSQSQKREGELTVEKLFAQSPPPSPSHFLEEGEDVCDSRFVSIPVSSDSIMDLDFVFKPLFNPFPVSDSVSSSESKRKSGYKNFNSKKRVNVRSVNLIHNNSTKGVKSKVIVKKIKNNKVALKRLKKLNKNRSLSLSAGETNRKTKVIPTRNVVRISNAIVNNNLNNSDAILSSNINKGSIKRFSKGSFGAPKKSSLLNLRSSFRAMPEVSKANHHLDRKSGAGVKRKLDQMSGEFQSSKNVSTLTPKSKFNVSFFPNLRSKSRVLEPPEKTEINKKYLQVAIDKVKLDSADTHSKVSSNREANTSAPITKEQKAHVESSKSHVLYYPVHPFVSHDLPVHFIPIDSSRIPQFLPLYSPVINSKNSSPIYPSFIRTLPSPKIKTPNDYVLSKGIKSRSVPIRSFSEEKVKENIFPSIAAAASKCPLMPEIPSFKLRNMNKPAQLSPSSKKESSTSSFGSSEATEKSKNIAQNPSNFVNTASPLHSQSKPNQKIHRCLKCDFTTQKLGVLKRHELSHSQGQMTENKGIIVNSLLKNNFVQGPPKLLGVSPSPKQFPTQKKSASLVNKEKRASLGNDQKNTSIVIEKKALLMNNQKNALTVKNKKNASIVNNQKNSFTIRINNEKKTSLLNNQKNTLRSNSEEKTSLINDQKSPSRINNEKNATVIQNQKNALKFNNEKNSSMVSDKSSDAPPKFDSSNIKKEPQTNKETLSSSDDSNSSFNGFTENSVREKFMKRFPGVTITPLYSVVES